MSCELFALPHAGGSISAFATWRAHLGALELTPFAWGDELALLGGEAALEPLAAAIGRRLERKIKGDFGLVGASAGGRVALAVAEWLSARPAGDRLRLVVLVSVPSPRALPELARLSRLGDPELFQALQELGGMPKDLAFDAALFGPGLARARRDLRLFRGSAAMPSRRGRYPLYIAAGHLDPLVDRRELAALSSALHAECALWPGDHFFWQEGSELPRRIARLGDAPATSSRYALHSRGDSGRKGVTS